MKKTKFTLNSFILIVIIFSVIAFFFTVKLTNMSDRFPVNEFYPIENSDLAVRYSSLDGNGIYKGDENTCVLELEGTYGSGWGAFLQGDCLYTNEYKSTDLGLIKCDLVKINTTTFEKELLYKDTVLRGVNKSGELVCQNGCIIESNHPKTNSLCSLYAMSSKNINPSSDSADVIFINPETGEAVYIVNDENALSDDFEERYINSSLEEVKQ